MGGMALQYSNELCYRMEKDYSTDSDVKYILTNVKPPFNIFEASKVIKRKENSKLLKLPIDLNAETRALSQNGAEYKEINDLSQITGIICSSGSLKMVLECIEIAGGEDIMLKVQGPFSCLLSVVGSNRLFKWLYKYEKEVESALENIADSLACYINEAIDRGVKIISFADPSGMAEVLGEKIYKKYAAAYTVKLLKKVEPKLEGALVHICPRTSIMLEKYGFMKSEIFYYDGDDYAQTLIELSRYKDIKFVGHRCINAEHTNNGRLYKLDIIRW